MSRTGLALLTALVVLFSTDGASAQDVLERHKVAAVRDLREVALVIRPTFDMEVVSVKECGDIARIALARNLPQLNIDASTSASRAPWLELSLITTNEGAIVVLTLYRWVNLDGVEGEPMFSPVWTETQAGFGRPTKGRVEDIIRSLVNAFSADALRANAK